MASDSQCAARYARDNAIRNENTAATVPQIARWRPVGTNAMTSATAVTDVATAWPEGNDDDVVCTSGCRGRARP